MKKLLGLAVAALLLVVGGIGEARAEGSAVLGTLVCKRAGMGQTFVVFSRHPVTCTYNGINGPQEYTGTTGIALGVDLEWESESTIAYFVMGASWTPKANLQGTFVGARATASLGLGLTAQAGVGGIGNDISLVPVGIGAQHGIGVAAGISYLDITAK
jgi:hypothetical protein